MGSTWYGRQICSRAFALATSRNGSLPSIGWKGRIHVRMEEQKEINSKQNKKNETPLHTRLGLSSKTMHTTVRKPINMQTINGNLQEDVKQ